MLKPATLLRVWIELILAMLGLLMVQLAFSGRMPWGRRSPLWLPVGIFLIYWGARAWRNAARVPPPWEGRLRGGSLALVGVVMLGMLQAPWSWGEGLLGAAGAILALRGLLSIFLVVRSR